MGKRTAKDRKRSKWGAELMSDYFGETPTYNARDFRRRCAAACLSGCALRMLAYGSSADQLDEFIRMGSRRLWRL
ncbi:hypothetical protein PF005_g20653 [Phytophthora fragariae]|uniref:Uncharacterized protein n=1 Tax=Phytophthora fragariae TaxID=53985 RepID=A0A6A3F2H6_9STRA|nr:hypothetical protein PF003_g19117 [Phytophthora fragariae]KAE8939925.1 hypothetical protein PF009_g10258 [Phytophthora fragariae]KAE8977337.1 hypothetical protein PF011_g23687 [Phytophthora fragariae]KAE9137128.1 hypothetical protein PF006_g14253 [Phytophthora fragariae]KAE9186930.1 hypothetical protein PF005_g20653 [Phytophthora fragariae]